MSLPLVELLAANDAVNAGNDAGNDAANVVDIVWVHGFGGAPDHLRACADALAACARLEAQRRAVRLRAVRLPGHGGGAVSSFDDAVSALAASVDDDTVLWGYSLGARLSLAVAARRPLRALILESGRGSVDDEARARADDDAADDLVARGVDAFFADWEQGPLFAHLSDDQRAARARARASYAAADLAAALRAFSPGRQRPVPYATVSRRMPVLLLAGANDARYVAHAASLAATLELKKGPVAITDRTPLNPPTSKQQGHSETAPHRTVIVPNVGHVLHIEAPRAVAAAVADFVSDLPAAFAAPR